jgi:hypothetical protein
MLDVLLLLSTAAFVLTGAVVGARLLWLASRTREPSDWLVGFSLFELSAIAYPIILLRAFGELSLPALKLVSIASGLALALGWACTALFTQRAFRSGEPWARALAALCLALLGGGFAAATAYTLRAGDAATVLAPKSPALWIEAGGVLAFVWTTAEGLRCWRNARRRLALGLAEPLVANRFLLWAVVGMASLVTIVPALVISLSGGDGTTHAGARARRGGGLPRAPARLPPAGLLSPLGRGPRPSLTPRVERPPAATRRAGTCGQRGRQPARVARCRAAA